MIKKDKPKNKPQTMKTVGADIEALVSAMHAQPITSRISTYDFIPDRDTPIIQTWPAGFQSHDYSMGHPAPVLPGYGDVQSEAIARMEQMGIPEVVRDRFMTDGTVFACNSSRSSYFPLNSEQHELVRNYEEVSNSKVFLVMRDDIFSENGAHSVQDAFFFVSPNLREWADDVRDLACWTAMAFVVRYDVPMFSGLKLFVFRRESFCKVTMDTQKPVNRIPVHIEVQPCFTAIASGESDVQTNFDNWVPTFNPVSFETGVPLPATAGEVLREAKMRMQILPIREKVKARFIEEGKVCIYLPNRDDFYLLNKKQRKLVREFEEKHTAKVYLVLRSYFQMQNRIQTVDSFLFVGGQVCDWPSEMRDLLHGCPYAYAYNNNTPKNSGFGYIYMQSTTSHSLFRIA